MWNPTSIKQLTIVSGHYGSGKTNLSLNLALDNADAGRDIILVDLDIVNPYFRSSDYTKKLQEAGVEVIAPNFAGTTLDNPSLSGGIDAVFSRITSNPNALVIFDVGGDDAGATTLGRYAGKINSLEHDFLYVINENRNLTSTSEEAVEILHEIEDTSNLTATGIVNNSHMQDETTTATVVDSLPYAEKIAEQLLLPLICTTIPYSLSTAASGQAVLKKIEKNLYPVRRYVHTLWDSSSLTN